MRPKKKEDYSIVSPWEERILQSITIGHVSCVLCTMSFDLSAGSDIYLCTGVNLVEDC